MRNALQCRIVRLRVATIESPNAACERDVEGRNTFGQREVFDR